MLGNYGFKLGVWEAAKAEARAVLVETARAKELITCAALVARIKTVALTPDDPRLTRLLFELGTEEAQEDRPLLPALVVQVLGEIEPRLEFVLLAEKLGRDLANPAAAWRRELDQVYCQYHQ